MKLFFGILFSLLTVTVSQENPMMTEGLLKAQEDLILSHNFFEIFLYLNRDETSAYLYRINREVVKAHLEAIERTELNEQCIDNVINRWHLQFTR
jgi:hypothetical protein